MVPDRAWRLKHCATALRSGALAAPAVLLCSTSVPAQERLGQTLVSGYDPGMLLTSALTMGAAAAALVAAVVMIRDRARTARQNAALRNKLAELGARNTTLGVAASAEGQATLVWTGDETRPDMIGRLDANTGAPEQRAAFLAFGRWLEPLSAADLERHLAALRSQAARFTTIVTSTTGVPIEVRGSAAGSGVIARFVSLQGERARLEAVTQELERANNALGMLHSLLESTGNPAWICNPEGRLVWASTAYLEACETASVDDAIARNVQLFGGQSGDRLQLGLRRDGSFAGELSTVVSGQRIVFATRAVTTRFGSAGLAEDVTEAEQAQRELSKMVRSHEETLDELTTAVAMFDDKQRLRFHNSAFRQLWGLDAAFLEQGPNADMFLNRLRSEGKLPEQPDFNRWKAETLSAFQAIETEENWWYLPDSQTLRVVANPLPKGGLTWVFENLTERIDLESRYKTLMRVQTETIDHLSEGVAVFSSDGVLKLCNPSFRTLCGLDTGEDPQRTVHIRQIADLWRDHPEVHAAWIQFAGSVTGFEDGRVAEEGRMTIDGQVLDWATAPLPNGQTMLTFRDVTGPDQIEQALRERNEALERTAQLRNRFIQHVSYELRAPLTTIKGFAELMRMSSSGSLNERQSEYLDHIEQSSGALTTVTDAILDLATVDAGLAELDPVEFAVADLVQEAVSLQADRLQELDIKVDIETDPASGHIFADRHRILQVLDNVLSNAADFAPSGSTIHVGLRRSNRSVQGVEITVRDHGPGIAPKYLEDAFERFQTIGKGRNRGAGLGLSIVKSFVELHGGTVSIKSAPDWGTEVSIFLPAVAQMMQAAAQ